MKVNGGTRAPHNGRVPAALHSQRGAGGARKLVPAKRKGARLLAKSLFSDREFRSLTAGVAKALKNDIVRGAYLPEAKLRIAELAEFYGVSPGAVREALSRLVSEGLVEFNEQRGFRAAPVSEADLTDITRTRVLIECEALRAAMRSASPVCFTRFNRFRVTSCWPAIEIPVPPMMVAPPSSPSSVIPDLVMSMLS